MLYGGFATEGLRVWGAAAVQNMWCFSRDSCAFTFSALWSNDFLTAAPEPQNLMKKPLVIENHNGSIHVRNDKKTPGFLNQVPTLYPKGTGTDCKGDAPRLRDLGVERISQYPSHHHQQRRPLNPKPQTPKP